MPQATIQETREYERDLDRIHELRSAVDATRKAHENAVRCYVSALGAYNARWRADLGGAA